MKGGAARPLGAVLGAALLLAGCRGPGLPAGTYTTPDGRWELTVEPTWGLGGEDGRIVLVLPNGEERVFQVEGNSPLFWEGESPQGGSGYRDSGWKKTQ